MSLNGYHQLKVEILEEPPDSVMYQERLYGLTTLRIEKKMLEQINTDGIIPTSHVETL
jgi:hypothetical protein